MNTPPDPHAAVERLCHFFETLTPQRLDAIGQFYTDNARFKDPFNEVRGVNAIQDIFKHMYDNLHEPHFVVTQRVVDGAQCFLVWEFRFRFKRFDTATWQSVRGAIDSVVAQAGGQGIEAIAIANQRLEGISKIKT